MLGFPILVFPVINIIYHWEHQDGKTRQCWTLDYYEALLTEEEKIGKSPKH